MDESLRIIEKGAVAIDKDNIIEIGKENKILEKYTSDKIIKINDSIIMPGLINTHTHAAMVYFRGIADDLPLNEWLNNHIWPAENKWLSSEFIKDAIELACLEMLKGGITTFNDMYFFNDSAAESCKRLGIRAVLGSGILDFPSVSAKTTEEYFENAVRFIQKWKNDELITPCIAPHAVYTCGPETLRKSAEIAEKMDVPIHIHLSETEWEVGEILLRYKKRPVEYLDELGFLNERVLAAHCIWLHDNEIELLANNKVGVSHCMESNLKLASGFAPVATMLSAGIKITFGTDGAASNNDLNIFSEMSTTAKVHKALSNNPTVLDAKSVVLMATRWGAEVLGLGNKTGSLEPGKSADLIIINLKKPHLRPIYNIYSHIVYSAMASDVEYVMVKGKFVIEKRRHANIDEEEILFKAKKWGEKIRET